MLHFCNSSSRRWMGGGGVVQIAEILLSQIWIAITVTHSRQTCSCPVAVGVTPGETTSGLLAFSHVHSGVSASDGRWVSEYPRDCPHPTRFRQSHNLHSKHWLSRSPPMNTELSLTSLCKQLVRHCFWKSTVYSFWFGVNLSVLSEFKALMKIKCAFLSGSIHYKSACS